MQIGKYYPNPFHSKTASFKDSIDLVGDLKM